MSNKLLNTYLLLAFATAFSFSSVAQTSLEFGAEDPSTLVKTPYIHWDYLRTLNPEWTREERSTPTAPWEPLNRVYNEKDANGLFTLLNSQVWSYGTNDWVDDNKYTYAYTLDANNRISEMQASDMNQFYTNSRTAYYEYDSAGNVTRAAYESNGNIYYEQHFSYDGQGLRTVDSAFGIQGGNLVHNGLTYYEYNADNRCIKIIPIYKISNTDWDSFGYTLYTWQGSQLTTIEQYGVYQLGGSIFPISRAEYTYDNGQVTDVASNIYDTTDLQYHPVAFYKHYYANNRMTAMVSGGYNSADRKNEDSVALTYLTNGNLDSGLEYTVDGNGNWETAARYRLLFRKINTGIAPVAPVINAVNVYPNPVADYLTVDIETVIDGNFSLQVMDLNGRVVKTVNAVNMPAGKNTIRVSTQDFAPGVYVITCGNNTVKVIKE